MDASAGEPSEPASVGILEDAAISSAPTTHPPPRLLMDDMEWCVTSIRESIPAEDLGAIRLRRSTIEAGTARLGGGRQGTMQLLKLILTWAQSHHKLSTSSNPDKRQGAKPADEKLRFLLHKELKHSDVTDLGRIVLPKREAEVHLPELKEKHGIPIPMEDIGTSRVWNMRYKFWPNNKSRMYVLENTGEFVRSNELQQGDFIVIYSDVKSGKYLIRGVKVRLPNTTIDSALLAHLVRDISEVDFDEVDLRTWLDFVMSQMK